MKTCANNFLEVLKKVVLEEKITVDSVSVPLRSIINVNDTNAVFTPLTKFNNNRLSGERVSFTIIMTKPQCTLDDYPSLDVSAITMPSLDIHPLHKQ